VYANKLIWRFCRVKETAELFKVLSVDKRIEIVELLKKEPMSVNALAEALGITQSAASQHLRVLKSAGLVKDERQGYWIYYSLNRDALEKCRQRLNRVCTCGCLGGQIRVERIPRKASGSG
jgi:ArsR family transcriptional regulator, arsenate/arsenite/antimonite-responsive transcriptional repressor